MQKLLYHAYIECQPAFILKLPFKVKKADNKKHAPKGVYLAIKIASLKRLIVVQFKFGDRNFLTENHKWQFYIKPISFEIAIS